MWWLTGNEGKASKNSAIYCSVDQAGTSIMLEDLGEHTPIYPYVFVESEKVYLSREQ